MDRLLNYSFAFILIYVCALWAPVSVHILMIIFGLIASFLFCSVAFIIGWLTISGAAAAVVVGTIAFGIGGWPVVIAVIGFFLSSALISIKESPFTTNSVDDENTVARRDGIQVWANGFWLVVWLLAGIATNLFICWMAALAVIATATADTWATELGSRRFATTTYLPMKFDSVPPGTDGGISWPGMAASLAGSLFIALIALFGFSLSAGWFFCITLAGFSGSVFDSYLGATFQGYSQRIKLPTVNWQQNITIDNNMVNWLSTGFGALMLLILNQIFL